MNPYHDKQGRFTTKAGAYHPLLGRTPKQNTSINKLCRKTAKLKKEQYRIINANGETVLEKRGDEHSVNATVGEKREHLAGCISLHNHPSGGTFSPDDLSDFGYGARELVVATPEGTYRLVNEKYGTPEQFRGWVGLRDAVNENVKESESSLSILQQAQDNTKNTRVGKRIETITRRFGKIRKEQGMDAAREYMKQVFEEYDGLLSQHSVEIRKEVRRLETQPYHEFYKQNAKKYGFIYRFEPN